MTEAEFLDEEEEGGAGKVEFLDEGLNRLE